MAWNKDYSQDRQPGFVSTCISYSCLIISSVLKVREVAILQIPFEARPNAAMATGVDCLYFLINSLRAMTAAACREGLKSFMVMDLVTSSMITTARMACTSLVVLSVSGCWIVLLCPPPSMILLISSILLYLFIYNIDLQIAIWSNSIPIHPYGYFALQS